MHSDYADFIASKSIQVPLRGMSSVPKLASHLRKFQANGVDFGLRAGSWGCFFDTGLGKTAVELEWLAHALAASNDYGLILTPLAVARQIEREGKRWGYDVRAIRSHDEAMPGINICNYDRLELLDPSRFGAVVLDESSIIKNFSGKTTRSLINAFAQHRWRLAATATPAPNDFTELGNHSEFLGVMPMNDMLVRWFINDTADTGTWRLKGHARDAYWEWLSSWSRVAEHPRDLGDDVEGYDLPKLEVIRHYAEVSDIKPEEGTLFAMDVSATGIHGVKRQTAENRARSVATILDGHSDPFVVWCDTDYESEALKAVLAPMFGKKLAEIKGSLSIDAKESAIAGFADGTIQGLITKPSITGFGLNWQHCNWMACVGRSFSYESWYQLVRRFWRFGQTRTVYAHIIVAEGEDSIGRVLDRKADDHISMKREMTQAMRRSIGIASKIRKSYEPKHEGRFPSWL